MCYNRNDWKVLPVEPRIYTYKITFPSQGWWYWGVHKERKFGEKYSGSPRTHKEKWDLFHWEFQILEFFDSYDEAREVETRLIRPDLNNPMCLNEGCGGHYSEATLADQSKRAREMMENRPELVENVRKMGETWGKINITNFNESRTAEERSEGAKRASMSADQEKRKLIMSELGGTWKGSRYANNGKKNKRIRVGETLPEGFQWGYLT